MNIKKITGTAATTAAPGRKIQYLVIHYTAGTTSRTGSAVNTAKYFGRANNQAGSADYIVDDSEAVQYNPDPKNRYCWAVGGGKLRTGGGKLHGKATNKNSISIEICSTNSTGRVPGANDRTWTFTDAAVQTAAALARQLMEEFRIPPERVIRHYDVTGKLCPGIVGWNEDSGDISEWETFRAMLTENEEKGETEVRYQTMAELPAWARPAVTKLVRSGKLNGKSGKKDAQGFPTDLDLSEDMIRLIVMLG